MTKVLVQLAYIQRYVYPGDFSSYMEGIQEFDDCLNCRSAHVRGKVIDQWNCNILAGPKRDENEVESLTDDINANGIKTPIRINVYEHKVVVNGHHRVYALMDLGWKWIPAEFIDTRTYEFYYPPFARNMIKPWSGHIYTESNHQLVLAS